ncbi:MAG: ribonuclease P protein subunit [Candidatus Nitrosocaldaceae archaeon]
MSKIELLGLNVRIIDSRDPTLLNLTGKIVYESKNMIHLLTNNSIKMIPKQVIRLESIADASIIEGKDIIGRPEDRIRR